MGSKIVVIGGVAAGPKAAARARRRDPEAEITLVEKGEFLSYAGCGLPFYVAGLVKEADELMRTRAGILRDSAYFKSVKNIEVLPRTLAERIDRQAKEVVLLDLAGGERSRLPYDKMVIATGGCPIVPQMPGLDLKGVYRLGNPADAVAIRDAIDSEGVSRVAVIGGGLIGLEVADALSNQGLDVVILEMREQLLQGVLDPDMAALVAKQLRERGIDLRLGLPVTGLEGDSRHHFRAASTAQGPVEADLAILAIGVRPNVKLASDAGLALGPTGAIRVDEYLRTSDPDIYAGGDCVESYHLVTGKPTYVPLGSTANKHGRVIGDNVTGGRERFPGVVGTTVFKTMGCNVGRTGLTEQQAREAGYTVVTSVVPSPDCAHYYPSTRMVVVKLVADAESGRLLGAQALGPGEAVKRIDVAATALTFGATLEQVANLDLGYAPPFSTAIDVIAHSANTARNKLAGLAASISPLEVKRRMEAGDDFVLLDVRDPREYEQERIDDRRVRLIPLGELRERLGELPRDREIVAFCKLSLRGYEACTILTGAGFTEVKFMDGGLEGWPYELAEGKGRGA
jgi:NADPH-dependent 2,4-dienoyl-CoA reductase/sulfur reductase-like enzyme/rhodanese-related sulfurtransferase